MTIQYHVPDHWIRYDPMAVIGELTEAKASILSLTNIPFQRSWAENLQEIELKREVAGTSRIEGADFTEREFEEAVADNVPDEHFSRSQRQARAAINTYRWIEGLERERPIDENLVKEIHRRIVTGCDDDHCPPGQLRGDGHNVSFGRPRHRGVEGGSECSSAIRRLIEAVNQEFRGHDPLVQALALHYHIGAMHPFHDGNGRTARALEAFVLRRAHLKDMLFIAMSNYYYDEKDTYLACLSEVRKRDYDLTPFVKFGLKGVSIQCRRLLREIGIHIQRSLFRDIMGRMYGRLRSTRKRALAQRQYEILNKLLDTVNEIEYRDLFDLLEKHYGTLKTPLRAYVRDLNHLSGLRAIIVRRIEGQGLEPAKFLISVRLEWATEITETEFYRQINRLPEAKTRLVTSG
ncbi:MAG: Fic family protein [Bryobacterales bacterium]|nr:Fic family protein [Bryobacterales bacterium]